MKKILFPFFLLLLLNFQIFSQFNGGSGTIADPYQVSTANQLNMVRDYLTSHFIQTTDVSLNSYSAGEGWTPIGYGSSPFTGSYNGDGHKVMDLIINPNYPMGKEGLFSRLGSGAEIKNLGLEGVIVHGNSYVGTLVGELIGGTITNCYSTCMVTGGSTSGGLIGMSSSSTITSCYATGSVTGDSEVGGLIAYSSDDIITQCFATGSVGGISNVGGLVGKLNYGSVTKSYATGNINSTNLNALNDQFGGFVGSVNAISGVSVITDCWASGNVTGNPAKDYVYSQFIGGFAGANYEGTITNCFSRGGVFGTADYGGFCGKSIVTGNYAITNSFWDITQSGQSASSGGMGKTTQQMTTESHTFPNFYTNAGWDFYGESANGTNEVWNINTSRNSGYPFLTWQYPSDAPLPVELKSFTVTPIDLNVVLTWQTATEVNNYGFEIERSQAKESWSKVGFVTGNGNSNSPKEYTFSDQPIKEGQYFYRLKQIDNDGKFEYSKVVEVNYKLPIQFSLEQNYPNPFNPSTIIKYSVPKTSKVSLKIFDQLGKQVTEVVNEEQAAGNYEIKFNASGLSSGIYFYRLTSGSIISTQKMIFTK